MNNDKYYELTITLNPNFVETIADVVSGITDEGIEIADNAVIVRSENELNELKIELEELMSEYTQKLDIKFELEQKENSDWIEAYKNSIEPIEAGSFYIHPSWYEPLDQKINIMIDPALAFGSGHHATTASCLEMISRYAKSGNKVADIGCGSGILGLACKKLGVGTIDLCDTDPLAVQSAKENFERNGETFDNLWEGSSDKAKSTYDLVIANIIADVLCWIAKDLKKITNPNGLLVLSGILDKKESLVLEAYKDLELIDRILKDEWVTLVYKKETNAK
jgi:ribosomal protein L11 methyltransferase